MDRIVSEIKPIDVSYMGETDDGLECPYEGFTENIRRCRITWGISYIINRGSVNIVLDIERIDISFSNGDEDSSFINNGRDGLTYKPIIDPSPLSPSNLDDGKLDIFPVQFDYYENMNLIEVVFNG